jgi:hypothetical protein
MQRANSIFRSGIICLLVLSMGAVGLCSQSLMAVDQASCGKAATGATTIRTCCCANCDGRCGGACCKQNSTKPVPPQLPSRSEDSKHNTVMLVVQVGSLVAGSNGAGVRQGDPSSFGGSQAVVSLQSQHVRIQT